MNEGTKRSATQVALLVGLLLVLGFAVFNMIKKTQRPARKDRPAATASTSKPAAGARPSSTNMPRVPGSPGDKGPSGGVEIQASDLRLNPNMFKVYALNPPKNPFVQSEGWYKDTLQQVPGYPELKGSDYFESPEAYLPNIDLIDEKEWDMITVDRTISETPYEISGTSADGTIVTRVQLKEKAEQPDRLNWSRATGVPVKALLTPGWKEKYGDVLSGELPAAQTEDDGSGFVKDALGVPGADGSRSASDMLDGGGGAGDALYCVGVSHHGKEATALVRFNGKTRIVREGSVIPTHFQVLSIKEDGVVVVDLNDGTSGWLPLGAAPAASRENAKKVRKVNDA